MSRPIEFVAFACPWCGEPGETTIDMVSNEGEWVEDCAVCCSPIVFRCRKPAECGGDDVPEVEAEREGG
ncbi:MULTISPECIES: CPXCG motif-containing cysteine-rich protein [Thioalkalivibrio]|uniref:CPXCG motif-containing cysteine-rich protein n=1 Tax=Thioalkalivibrio halophilus TaxID=252474 RepID=A0A1V3A071_9GAMM|nr:MULTISPECIES: CPXCG motif-containing cysteine-rich protein [Thioalkalivibrio]OOC10483.1 CPXCG motif-containing cysteine-rich protein [Thioalkalivibrio halophilus]PYG03686.1 Cysteine-rich CPXCG [Thioalkalivibrio sp. ALE21]